MAFEIHREPLYRRYYASYFSAAFLYALLFGFILIILPFIIAYNSSSFWLKENITYEQPNVSFKYDVVFEMSGINIDSSTGISEPFNIFYSTSSILNQYFGDNLRVGLLQSKEFDDNQDNNNDRIEFGLQMPIKSTEQILSFNAVFLNEVKLSSKGKYVFESASYVNYESASGIGNLFIDGDLMLRQTWPLLAIGGFKTPYVNVPLLPISDTMSVEDAFISNIMSKANSRNLTMNFVPHFQYATRFTGATDFTPQYVNASIIQRIPIQSIRYTPPVSEVLKNAWIQYMSFFIVIAFIISRLNSFIFRHKLINTHAVADIMVEKFD